MALKGSLRSQRSKRFNNVFHHLSSIEEKANSFSCDSQSETVIRQKKVRKGFSTKRLIKESECFTVDNDHVYTLRSPETDYSPIRKRKISEESDEKIVKKRCFSKNAVMARLNRERKKVYVASLESENEYLRKEKTETTRIIEEQNKKISAMDCEILYLKGLLANSKELVLLLENLRETTGLPVTSSMIHSSKGNQSDSSKSSPTSEQDGQNMMEYQTRIKSVNSGNNFPILEKDINLGSCSDNCFDASVDLENNPFGFENFSYDMSTQPVLNEEDNYDDSYFNFCTGNFNSDLDECLQLKNLSKNKNPPVGICLHVNQKKISVEICSACNGKAAESLE